MKRLRIAITGVGGQGTLLASNVLGDAAIEHNIPVISSEVHGMAQRGGVVETSLILGGYKGPLISEGEADVLLSFEPLETLRSLPKCNKDTVIITNTTPIVPVLVTIGLGQYPDVPKWIEFMKSNYKKVYALDADSIAKECGSQRAMNIVMVGVLCSTDLLPFSIDSVKNAICRRVKKKDLIDINLKAFEKGYEIGKSIHS